MKDVSIRLAALLALVGFGLGIRVVTADTPSDAIRYAMKCLAVSAPCTTWSQRFECQGQSQGSYCTFCDGDGALDLCVASPPDQCVTTGGTDYCGKKVLGGECELYTGEDPPVLVCTSSNPPSGIDCGFADCE
jgi:hypothetical protein